MIREERVLDAFPGRTELDLYLWISNHRERLALEARDEGIGPEAAKDDILKQSRRRRRLQVPNMQVPGRSSRSAPETTDPENPGETPRPLSVPGPWASRPSSGHRSGCWEWPSGATSGRLRGDGRVRRFGPGRRGRTGSRRHNAVAVRGLAGTAWPRAGLAGGRREDDGGRHARRRGSCTFVWWISVSLAMQLVTRFFGGEGPFGAMVAVVGVAAVPLALGALLQAIGSGPRWRSGSRALRGDAGFVGGFSRSSPSCGTRRSWSWGRRWRAGSATEKSRIVRPLVAGCLALIILVAVVVVGAGILIGATAW